MPNVERTRRLPPLAEDGFPWERPGHFPPGGLTPQQLLPLLEWAFFNTFNHHVWSVLGKYWHLGTPALKELCRGYQEGMPAMARFLARQLLKTLPKTALTEERLWEDFCIFSLRACHEYAEDEGFKAYLRFRADRPHLLPFLRRVVRALSAKESPELLDRLQFCGYWDLYVLPMRFWSDEAAAALLSGAGTRFNLDKVRNTRRELDLRRNAPIIVKSYKRLPPKVPGGPPSGDIQLDEAAAKRAGASAMLKAFTAFLQGRAPGS